MPALYIPIAMVVAAGIVAGGSAYTSAKQATQERKLQEEALDFQRQQVAKAETKVAGAEALAEQIVAEKKRKQRLAQTQTILTSPLGIEGGANTSMPRLLGGG
jgi:hypothetical protein